MDDSRKCTVNTFVFLDLESTGLYGIGDKPRITEIFLQSIGRAEFLHNDFSSQQRRARVLNSLRLSISPRKPITPAASIITGLFNDVLEDQGPFDTGVAETIQLFLARLKKPVCLLAYNGNKFDFPLLKTELNRVNSELQKDLLCADTLEAFKQLDEKDQLVQKTPEKLAERSRKLKSHSKQKVGGQSRDFLNIVDKELSPSDFSSSEVCKSKIRRKLWNDDMPKTLIRDQKEANTAQNGPHASEHEGSGSMENNSLLHTSNVELPGYVKTTDGDWSSYARYQTKRKNDDYQICVNDILSDEPNRYRGYSDFKSDNKKSSNRLSAVTVANKHTNSCAEIQLLKDENKEKSGNTLKNFSLKENAKIDFISNLDMNLTEATYSKKMSVDLKCLDEKRNSTLNESQCNRIVQDPQTDCYVDDKNLVTTAEANSSFESNESDELLVSTVDQLEAEIQSKDVFSSADFDKIYNSTETEACCSHSQQVRFGSSLSSQREKIFPPIQSSCLISDTIKMPLSSPDSMKLSYKLKEVYRREFGTYPAFTHCAEDDTQVMMQIAYKKNKNFVAWVDQNISEFSSVKVMYN